LENSWVVTLLGSGTKVRRWASCEKIKKRKEGFEDALLTFPQHLHEVNQADVDGNDHSRYYSNVKWRIIGLRFWSNHFGRW
jgi:hypothetical protein